MVVLQQRETHVPEVALWRAVIAQAIADACATLPSQALNAQHARTWFEKAGTDFVLACNLAGLEPDAVRRLARQKIAEAQPINKRFGEPRRFYTHDGLTLFLAQWAKRTGLAESTIRARLRKGMSICKALTALPQRGGDRKARLYEYNGESLTLRQWSKRTGINRTTLRNRIEIRNMPIAGALCMPVASQRRRPEQTNNPGVVANFDKASGTGGGSRVRDFSLSECPDSPEQPMSAAP